MKSDVFINPIPPLRDEGNELKTHLPKWTLVRLGLFGVDSTIKIDTKSLQKGKYNEV